MVQKEDDAILKIAAQRRWCEDDARLILKAWGRSKEPLSHFAKRHGLRRERLFRWASRIEKPERNELGFHQVRLVEAHDISQSGREKIEVVLTDGRFVRVPHGFAPEELRQVLKVLEEGT